MAISRVCARVAQFSTERSPLPISETSLNTETPYNICFLRHGQSTWNRDNKFIGWNGELELIYMYTVLLTPFINSTF
jgi:hypothetical protein